MGYKAKQSQKGGLSSCYQADEKPHLHHLQHNQENGASVSEEKRILFALKPFFFKIK